MFWMLQINIIPSNYSSKNLVPRIQNSRSFVNLWPITMLIVFHFGCLPFWSSTQISTIIMYMGGIGHYIHGYWPQLNFRTIQSNTMQCQPRSTKNSQQKTNVNKKQISTNENVKQKQMSTKNTQLNFNQKLM